MIFSHKGINTTGEICNHLVSLKPPMIEGRTRTATPAPIRLFKSASTPNLSRIEKDTNKRDNTRTE